MNNQTKLFLIFQGNTVLLKVIQLKLMNSLGANVQKSVYFTIDRRYK